ncbi:MAG: L,D-transpeptidase [Actinobacteria bacterium]|nr:L,D-transpeptidase [Actinomycetota bacterium]
MGAPEQESGSLAATGKGAEVSVHAKPDGEVVETFENPTPTGVPLTFMVVSTKQDWMEVQLPVRPNGRTAWVSKNDVMLTEVYYSLKVKTADNTLELYRSDDLVESFPVATGTGGTPTPTGTYYLTELIATTNEGYGPFAYGISAFSDELNSFGGGPGQVGLDGTDDEDSIGQAVSHGCIRMTNAAITKLSALLPLGTPIEIT